MKLLYETNRYEHTCDEACIALTNEPITCLLSEPYSNGGLVDLGRDSAFDSNVHPRDFMPSNSNPAGLRHWAPKILPMTTAEISRMREVRKTQDPKSSNNNSNNSQSAINTLATGVSGLGLQVLSSKGDARTQFSRIASPRRGSNGF